MRVISTSGHWLIIYQILEGGDGKKYERGAILTPKCANFIFFTPKSAIFSIFAPEFANICQFSTSEREKYGEIFTQFIHWPGKIIDFLAECSPMLPDHV